MGGGVPSPRAYISYLGRELHRDPQCFANLTFDLFSAAVETSQISPISNIPLAATHLIPLFSWTIYDCWHRKSQRYLFRTFSVHWKSSHWQPLLFHSSKKLTPLFFASVLATDSLPILTYLLMNLHQPAHTTTHPSPLSTFSSNAFYTPTFVVPSIFLNNPLLTFFLKLIAYSSSLPIFSQKYSHITFTVLLGTDAAHCTGQ